jgi:hypothetical protein
MSIQADESSPSNSTTQPTQIVTDLSQYLLNATDCEMLTTGSYDDNFPNQDKMNGFFTEYSKTHNQSMLNKADYTKVYITSDLHADIGRLVQFLLDLILISFYIPFNIYTTDDEKKYSDELYTDLLYGDNLKWIGGSNKVFIIVGDLVDGRREGTEIPDSKGTAEFLLHVFLYNLRIKAIKEKSEVLFTIGNHDVTVFNNHKFDQYTNPNTVEKKDDDTISTYDTNYKNDKLMEWLTTVEHQISTSKFEIYQKCLFKFYKCMNFLTAITLCDKASISTDLPSSQSLLSSEQLKDLLEHAEKDPAYQTFTRSFFDVLCVHASTKMNESGFNHVFLIYLQYAFFSSVISINDSENALTEDSADDLQNFLRLNYYYLNDRTFSKDTNSCKYLPDNLKLLVLGHCQTGITKEYPMFKKILKDDEDQDFNYVGCTHSYYENEPYEKSCVLIGCDNKLAFVDVAMSSAFQKYFDRREVLHLTLNGSNNYVEERMKLENKVYYRMISPQNNITYEDLISKTNLELRNDKRTGKSSLFTSLKTQKSLIKKINEKRIEKQKSNSKKTLHPLDIPYIQGNKSSRIADRAHATLERLRANLRFGGSRTKKQKRKRKITKKITTYKKRPLLSTNVSTKRRHTHRV